MRRITVLLCLLVLATTAYAAKKDKNRVVLDFATMYAVDEAFVGPTKRDPRDRGDNAVGDRRRGSTGAPHLARPPAPARARTGLHDPEVPPGSRG
jgi:hypothetical protein